MAFQIKTIMKNNIFFKIWKRIVWEIGQPLMKTPKNAQAQVSDLFIWRNSLEWKTYFELINIPSLFDQGCDHQYVVIVFFDENGGELLREKLDLLTNERQQIALSDYLVKIQKNHKIGESGVFSIFHSCTPRVVMESSSYISECGYVGYRYKSSPLNSYVHGNYEAISWYKGKLDLLGGSSILRRRYNLQYSFDYLSDYEIALVNISNRSQKVVFIFFDMDGNKVEDKMAYIQSGGSFFYKLKKDRKRVVRMTIVSNLIMARPVVFRIGHNDLNVFHG